MCFQESNPTLLNKLFNLKENMSKNASKKKPTTLFSHQVTVISKEGEMQSLPVNPQPPEIEELEKSEELDGLENLNENTSPKI